MKTKVIVAFLLRPQLPHPRAAFTAVRQKPAGNKLPLPKTVPVTADHPRPGVILVAPIDPPCPGDHVIYCGSMNRQWLPSRGNCRRQIWGAILNAMGSGTLPRTGGIH